VSILPSKAKAVLELFFDLNWSSFIYLFTNNQWWQAKAWRGHWQHKGQQK